MLQPSRPPAIVGLITPTVVYTVQRQTFGPWPHIGIEVTEIMPVATYLDPAPAVIFVLFVFMVLATLKHCCPRNVFWRAGHTMSGKTSNSILTVVTAATSNKALKNMGLSSGDLSSAVALEEPKAVAVTFPSIANCNKAAISVVRDVHRSVETATSFRVSTPQMLSNDNALIAAIAFAEPLHSAETVIFNTSQHGQKSELFTNHFHKPIITEWATQVKGLDLAVQMETGVRE